MADRVLFISWGQVVRGREARSLESFSETIGLYGRLQQEGKIESFDVVLLDPSVDIDGYMAIHGSHEQIAALKEDEDFRSALYDGSMVVDNLKMAEGYTGAGIAPQMEMYQEAIAKVPQLV
ncbi:MAG: hypothetical protein QOK19_628 [Solirubrobacteraceae bacterium]|nr:hypothetical protein [Solirubrobacteraceae bacterium]